MINYEKATLCWHEHLNIEHKIEEYIYPKNGSWPQIKADNCG